MTKKALMTEAEGKRLARIAKSEGVSLRIKVGDTEITIIPDIHREEDSRAGKLFDIKEVETL